MVKSMFAGVAGLRAHQSKMDVIGNNIANVNTYSFKAGRATFKDSFYNTMTPSSDADGVSGGGNSFQVGYGSQVGSIDVLHTRGSFAPTDNPMDVTIEGNGYFLVGNYNGAGYGTSSSGTGNNLTSLNLTRVGILNFGGDGSLVDANKSYVYGYKPYTNSAGEVSYGTPLIPDPADPAKMIFSKEKKLEVIELPKVVMTGGDNSQEIVINGKTVQPVYNAAGEYDAAATADAALELFTGGVFVPGEVTPECADEAAFKAMFTGAAAAPPAAAIIASSPAPIKLTGINIGANGIISGIYKEKPIMIGQLAVANVPNANGLEAIGGGYYKAKANTGVVTAEVPGQGSTGLLRSGGLEMANVDLAKEFSDMITTQRGFQANTRIITVSDEMLQELVNLKR